jgi:hypothetical protein
MSAANSTIALPADLLHDISEEATREGVPTEEWVTKALAERLRAQRLTEEFFRIRAAGASGLSLGAILDKGGDPDRDPDPGDELV